MTDQSTINELVEKTRLPEDFVRLMLDIRDNPEKYSEKETVPLEENSFWTVGDGYYYLKDGIIQYKEVGKKELTSHQTHLLYEAETRFMEYVANTTGYHAQSRGLILTRVIEKFVGRPFSDLIVELKARAVRSSAKTKTAKQSAKEWKEKWEVLRKRFDGNIIGIDKEYVNTHPDGFSILVLMKQAPRDERRAFVEKRTNDILLWCMEEIPNQKKLMKEIGSLDYYTPTEIVVKEANEIEVFFEAKKTIEPTSGVD